MEARFAEGCTTRSGASRAGIAGRGQTSIISPDGQLNFLSFATLLDGDKRFVTEKSRSGTWRAGVICCVNSSQLKITTSLCWPTRKFDRSSNAQIAKSDLPIEGSGVLRGTEKRDFEDMEALETLGRHATGERSIVRSI